MLRLGEQEYVRWLLAGLDAWPAYYAYIGPANTAGPAAPDLPPPQRADPHELHRRIQAGEWVVDLRDRTAFAAGFLPGALNFSVDRNFATYLGWAIPWGTPVTLLAATQEQVATAQRELVRIGIDPQGATVSTEDGRSFGYDYLVAAPGLQLDFDKVPGLTETLGRKQVSSNCRFDLAPRTWEFMSSSATPPAAPHCSPCPPARSNAPGAPQKIAYLAADWWRRQGQLDNIRVILVLPTAAMFSQPDWAKVLEGIAAGYGIEVRRESQLVEVNGDQRQAVVLDNKTGTKESIDYTPLHAVPRRAHRTGSSTRRWPTRPAHSAT